MQSSATLFGMGSAERPVRSRRDRKTKAIAEALAMIADTHPELAPNHPRPVRESDEQLWESATEFCAALDHYIGRTMEIKRVFTPAAGRPHAQRGTHPNLKLPMS
jgi:hypothetical protein